MIAQTMGNQIVKEDFERMVDLLKKGVALEKAIRQSRFLPNRVKSIMAIGIETGNLDENLIQLRDYEKQGFDAYISFLKSLATPVMMMLVGIIVAIVIVAVYLPMFKMLDLLKNPTGM